MQRPAGASEIFIGNLYVRLHSKYFGPPRLMNQIACSRMMKKGMVSDNQSIWLQSVASCWSINGEGRGRRSPRNQEQKDALTGLGSALRGFLFYSVMGRVSSGKQQRSRRIARFTRRMDLRESSKVSWATGVIYFALTPCCSLLKDAKFTVCYDKAILQMYCESPWSRWMHLI